MVNDLYHQLQVKCDELDALNLEKGTEYDNAFEMIKMLEDRLATKDNELKERSREYNKIYELYKKTTKQHADSNAKLR